MKTLYFKLFAVLLAVILLANLLFDFIVLPLLYNDIEGPDHAALTQVQADVRALLQNQSADDIDLESLGKSYGLVLRLEKDQGLLDELDSEIEGAMDSAINTEDNINQHIPSEEFTVIFDEEPDLFAFENDYYTETGWILPVGTDDQQWLLYADLEEPLSYQAELLLQTLLVVLLVMLAEVLLLQHWSQPLRQLLQVFEGNKQGRQIVPAASGSGLTAELGKEVTWLLDQHWHLRETQQDRAMPHQDLLHAVAHEFRSPMARLAFGLEMLNDSKSPAESAELHQDLEVALGEMDDLVREVLNYARLRDAREEFQYETVSINRVVDLLIAKQQTLTPGVDYQTQGEPQSIQVVRHLFERALINLVRNASRFAKTTVRIAWSHDEQGLVIRVEDDGIGIPPGKRERIFEPFTRLDASRSRDSGGVGLGLSIVQIICQRHEGRVEVSDSELGGACFTICLPTYSQRQKA